MFRIKKLDIFILKSFGMLFIGTSFICLFILMLQFLWRHVDELVGKGLEMDVLAQFFYYSGLSLVPAALPLAILLAALITFGNFGERYELLAMKAAGISLVKIMRPLVVFTAFLSGVSFFFQNVVGPEAEAQLTTLLFSMRQKSPELDIPEGAFYDEIDGYNLYVKKKNRKTGMLYDVTIYELAKGLENGRIITADSGKLEMTGDKRHLYLRLYSGHLFENLKAQSTNSKNIPYRRESFREKHSLIEFNSEFNMMDASIAGNQARSKDMIKLTQFVDSVKVINDSIGRQYFTESKGAVYSSSPILTAADSVKMEKENVLALNVDSLFNRSTLSQKQKVISAAANRTANMQSDWRFKGLNLENNDKNIRRHQVEWNRKITLALSCLIFFFIGAPLGSIIRKGGLGMPVIISVTFFIIYYVINSMGEKMARDGHWDMLMGTWLSTALLAPLGVFLTYKSNSDSVVFNADIYMEWLKKTLGIRSQRHLARKEVIIHDPVYAQTSKELEQLSAKCLSYLANHHLDRAPNYYKLWMEDTGDEQLIEINTRLEDVVEELANTTSYKLLGVLNTFPILSLTGHRHPFHNHWLNMATGIVFPVGLFFYFRVWLFRIRLKTDLESIAATSKTANAVIQEMVQQDELDRLALSRLEAGGEFAETAEGFENTPIDASDADTDVEMN